MFFEFLIVVCMLIWLILVLWLIVELVRGFLPILVDLLVVGRVVVIDGLLFAVGGAVIAAVLVLDGGLTRLRGLAGLRRGTVVDGDAVVLIQRRLSAARLVGRHRWHGRRYELGSAAGWA